MEKLYFNGDIITMEEPNDVVEAVLVADGEYPASHLSCLLLPMPCCWLPACVLIHVAHRQGFLQILHPTNHDGKKCRL